jgi:hypothetical protein
MRNWIVFVARLPLHEHHSYRGTGRLVMAALTWAGLEMNERWRAPGMMVGGGAPMRLAVS